MILLFVWKAFVVLLMINNAFVLLFDCDKKSIELVISNVFFEIRYVWISNLDFFFDVALRVYSSCYCYFFCACQLMVVGRGIK